VDHLIGRKLSQKYRFAEGESYQRRSLQLDGSYLPAKIQLCQDLLRLGQEEEGWRLADEVYDRDGYNVVAHNLVTLQDNLARFETLESGRFIVRMESREARIYGDRVLRLLEHAQHDLCSKYDVQIVEPIVVELFPRQQDFAIRTFGLPGGAGFLGVCFGRVITANSPASQAENPANWQAVLWHEFCHVVTLQKTKNKMPRWLSEGISVYEERQRDPSWGESMTPIYREMLLANELTPVSNLSAAFLSPPSPIHLQFAYYQSSLVVEFLIDRYGLEALKQILVDLGDGLGINDALVRSVGSLVKLDIQFSEFAREHARQFGSQADWSRDELPEKASLDELTEWVKDHPTNYWGLRRLAEAMVAARQIEAAQQPLEKLVELDTATGDEGGPLETLARVYAETDQRDEERSVHQRIIQQSGDALPSLRRLIEMAAAEEDWESVSIYAEKLRSINPLLPEGHQALAKAAERLDQPEKTVGPLSALLALDPIDPAGVDYRIAHALADLGQRDRAKHHLLRSLEQAPRYRDALRLLLALTVDKEAADQEAPVDEGADKEAPSDKAAEDKAAEVETPIEQSTGTPAQPSGQEAAK
jgi:tetratricopeptide (TPR) repeat protein